MNFLVLTANNSGSVGQGSIPGVCVFHEGLHPCSETCAHIWNRLPLPPDAHKLRFDCQITCPSFLAFWVYQMLFVWWEGKGRVHWVTGIFLSQRLATHQLLSSLRSLVGKCSSLYELFFPRKEMKWFNSLHCKRDAVLFPPQVTKSPSWEECCGWC